MSIDPGGGGRPDAEHGDQQQLAEREQADPEDLAGQQRAGADRGQQHLHDPARLLLDDAGRHPEAVADELAVQHEGADRHDGAARVRVGVGRVERVHGQRRHRLRTRDRVGVEAGVVERRGRP